MSSESNGDRQGDMLPAADPTLEQQLPQTEPGGPPAPMRPTDLLSAAEREALIASMAPEDAAEVPELHEVAVPEQLRLEIEEAMGRYPQLRSAVIPALWAVQRHHGWCSPEGIRQAAAVMGLTPAYLEAIASFYDLFHLEPAGRHRVLVCHNISCWMNGADELLAEVCDAAGCDVGEADHGGARSPDGELYVKGFECLGACDIAPMVSVDERYYGPLQPGEGRTLVEQLRAGAEPLPERDLRRRKLAGGPDDGEGVRIVEVPDA